VTLSTLTGGRMSIGRPRLAARRMGAGGAWGCSPKNVILRRSLRRQKRGADRRPLKERRFYMKNLTNKIISGYIIALVPFAFIMWLSGVHSLLIVFLVPLFISLFAHFYICIMNYIENLADKYFRQKKCR